MTGRISRTVALAAGAWLLLGSAQASAHSDVLPSCGAQQGGTMTGPIEMSPNVEHLGWVAGESLDLTPGGRRIGNRFYMTGQTHFSAYDISNPESPDLLARVNFQCRFENEDVATDGRSLVFSDFATTGSLYVYDVRDAANPTLLSELGGAGTHTASCVLDCRYLFGSYKAATTSGPTSTGQVVEMSDPRHPQVLGDWTDNDVLPSRKVHDVTEIAPGLVLSASDPIQLMDVREDPVKPKVLARTPGDGRRWHSVEWPRQGLDRFVLASFETNATPRCEAGVGDFAVFDASKAPQTGELEPRSTYLLTNDNNETSSGNPSVNAGLGCSPHWFSTRPSWHDGGVVALGAYDHGAKFLRVDPLGNISEVGHFRAPGTNASAAYWITCDIVYVVDYTRGLDILRFKDAASACPAGQGGAPGGPGGSGEGGDGSGGSGTPVSPAATRRERLRAYVQALWRVRGRRTQLRRLIVSRLPLATTVRVRCRGLRCDRAARRFRSLRIRRARIDTERLRRIRLRPGTRFVVAITRPGLVSQRVKWRIRNGRQPLRVRRH